MRNILFVISGPSGVGKGTIANLLCERDKNIALSISCTTRKPRKGEVDGREYFFITKEEFETKIANKELLEYSMHFENYYGTPKDYVLKQLENRDVLLEIDVDGGLAIKKNFPDAVLIMIAPPSLDELKHRLIARNTETEDKIKLRLARVEFELGLKDEYDYVVVNDDLNATYDKVREIINDEKNKQ